MYTVSLIAAYFLTAVSFAIFFLGKKCKKIKGGEKYIAVAVLFFSVYILRFVVGISTQELTVTEEISNSLVHALQTFSIDEDYTYYLVNGKALFEGTAKEAYSILISVLNVAAPFASGTIILDILIKFFPKFRHKVIVRFCKNKHYFSRLNLGSLSLAKDIIETYKKQKKHCFSFINEPKIIFAAVNEDVIDDELLAEAKEIGAVCLKDDLVMLEKGEKSNKLYLICDEEDENLNLLVRLADCCNKQDEVYLFVKSDNYINIESRIREKAKRNGTALPNIYIFHRYKNFVAKLLSTVPLFEAMIDSKEDELFVTIIGIGNTGMEMFLNTYWYGQIYGVKLNINVVSYESEEDFWGRVDIINPEIRQTTAKGHPILHIAQNEYSEPYCTVNYIQCDVNSSKFKNCLSADERILNSHYFFISLGTDDKNIWASNIVHSYIGEYHLKNTRKSIIAYVVYNSELANAMNAQVLYSSNNSFVNDIYLRAVGSMEEVFSVKNLEMTGKTDSQKRVADEYSYWSSALRKHHRIYKAFVLGYVKKSVFDFVLDSEKSECVQVTEKLDSRNTQAIEKYFDYAKAENKNDELWYRLTAMEHRRWNAYIRSRGLRYPADYRLYYNEAISGSHKNLVLKLHPCLVEATPVIQTETDKPQDGLDILYNHGLGDKKIYDEPMHDLD